MRSGPAPVFFRGGAPVDTLVAAVPKAVPLERLRALGV
jgi:hypothetical protein